jgi:hypothetical protein
MLSAGLLAIFSSNRDKRSEHENRRVAQQYVEQRTSSLFAKPPCLT